MARPATGSPRWNAKEGRYEARITLPGVGRRIVPMPGIEREDTARAARVARLISDKARKLGAVPESTAETVNEWFERYYKARELGRRGESVSDSRGRFRKWVSPQIGTLPIVDVTRDKLEALVASLDKSVERGELAWKTAANAWGEVTAGFSVAATAKDRALRVLAANPADGVHGPDRGIRKSKPFLRPDEIAKLLGCAAIPLERRHVYALACYTAMRQGELRGLRVGDVDLDAMQIGVVRQAKNGVEKTKTKTGRARPVTIEPNLLPLLRVLVEGKKPDEHLVSVRAHNRCASQLREDLQTAGCTRPALFVEDEMRAHLTFHNLRDTCLTHMAVRRDPPQDVQWRAGHTTPKQTEEYIGNARYEAGPTFGTPLAPLPAALLLRGEQPEPPEGSARVSAFWPDDIQETSSKQWRRRESNPGPKIARYLTLRA
ncbi:MAG: hypothetical protein JWP97_5419 [Labilithrix sp.]|nr:hypothetical protein [Labilithrix sp.]